MGHSIRTIQNEHSLLLMVRALELDASRHGHVRIGIVVVHARPAADGIHGIEQIVQKSVVHRVTVAILVGIHDAHDESDVARRNALVFTVVAGMMSAASLDELGKDGEGGEAQRVHGIVYLLDGRAAVFGIYAANAQELSVGRVNVPGARRRDTKEENEVQTSAKSRKRNLTTRTTPAASSEGSHDSRHLSRIIEALVPAADQPPVLVHAHGVLVLPIDDVLHGKLIAQLVGVRVAEGRVDAEGDADEGQALLLAGPVARVVGGLLARLAVLAVEGAHVHGRVGDVVGAAAGELRRQLSTQRLRRLPFLWLPLRLLRRLLRAANLARISMTAVLAARLRRARRRRSDRRVLPSAASLGMAVAARPPDRPAGLGQGSSSRSRGLPRGRDARAIGQFGRRKHRTGVLAAWH